MPRAFHRGMTKHTWQRIWRRIAFGVAALLVTLWFLTRPEMQNHFGYAVAAANGLPCRLVYGGRYYSNDELCQGGARTAWQVWYDARHHTGGPAESCLSRQVVARQGDWPLYRVGWVWTLIGAPHPIMEAVRSRHWPYAPTVAYVQNGACYQVYGLQGGP